MIGHSKPLYQIQKKIEYQKHLQRLDLINRERSKRLFQKQQIKQFKRKRNHSMHFQLKQQEQQLKQQNLILFNKIIGISRGRSKSPFINDDNAPNMIYFDTKQRKRLKKQITDNNLILAERILSKNSLFNAETKKKMKSQYEIIKKRLQRNKRATLPQLQQKSFRNNKSRQKTKTTSQMSQPLLKVQIINN